MSYTLKVLRGNTNFHSFITLVLFVGLSFTSVNAFANEKTITLKVQNELIENVFKLITNQSGVNFFYDQNVVAGTPRISISVKKESLENVLNKISEQSNLVFNRNNNTISVGKKSVNTDKQKNRTIKGQVIDASGMPIIGANVVLKGTTNGVITDMDGYYTLENVTSDGIIQISYIGYQTIELKANSENLALITLEEDAKVLNEVVVVGYGVQKKSSLTGSVASVSSKEIVKQLSSNVASTLQGRTPGVDIIQQAGVAGADVNIVIRGAASFGATEPLYVIDGAFSNSGLSSLNPNDIESIEVLKDGAAAAIYGSRAANGVVLITTKKGKSGKPTIEIDGSYAFQTPTNIPDFLNANQWRQFANMVADNSGLAHAPENDNPTYPNIDTDWANEWIQYAPMWNLNASVSGGGENSTFSTSIGYLDQTGMTIYSDYKRYNFRVNSSYKKGRLSLSESIALTHRDKTPTTAFNISLPTLPIYDEQGRFVSGGPDYYINPEDGKSANKIAPLHYTDRYNKTTEIIGSINAQLDIWNGLKYKFSFSANWSNSHNYTHTPEYYTKWNADGTADEDYGSPKNSVSESRGEEFTYTIDNLLTYNKEFNGHNFDVLLGTSWMREYYRSMSLSTIDDLGGTDITGFDSVDGKISAGSENSALLSFFGRLNYDYKGKYLFSASIRRDESSKFHKDNRVGYFPSVSGGWNVHQESWFENPIISKLKIRASYGELGANFLAPYNFDAIAYGPIPYTLGGQRYVAGRAAYLKSKDLKWETAKTTDVGLELGFLNDNLTIQVDYFVKKNVDLLAQIDLNLSSGQVFEINSSREKPYVNSASVRNTGWEFMINYRKQMTKDFHIDATANFSTLRNKVLSLGDNVQPITSGGMSSFFNDAPSITMPGEAIGSFYGYKIDGFDADGNFIFSDTDNNGIVNANDKVILGSPIPDFNYGLNVSMTYKDFDLTMFFQGVYGNEIFNQMKYTYYFDYSNNCVTDVLNAWTQTNKNTGIPVMKTQNTNGGNSLPSEFYIEDGSYLRFKNLQIGYNVPKSMLSKINFNKLRFYVGVQNLFTITDYSGYDPEVSSNALFSRGIDSSSYPNARTFTLGFNASF